MRGLRLVFVEAGLGEVESLAQSGETVSWWRFWVKKPKISAEVTPAEFNRYKAAAERAGVTFSVWLRKSLNETCARAEGIELPPEPPPETKTPPPTEHACRHLNPGTPGAMTSGDCVGACARQGGRACFWASAVAQRCTLFQPRQLYPPLQNTRR